MFIIPSVHHSIDMAGWDDFTRFAQCLLAWKGRQAALGDLDLTGRYSPGSSGADRYAYALTMVHVQSVQILLAMMFWTRERDIIEYLLATLQIATRNHLMKSTTQDD
ncbi:hypothetical protein ACJX0J_030275, partial [Zea mays]